MESSLYALLVAYTPFTKEELSHFEILRFFFLVLDLISKSIDYPPRSETKRKAKKGVERESSSTRRSGGGGVATRRGDSCPGVFMHVYLYV